MKNEEGISVFPAIGKLRDQRKCLYLRSPEFFCIRNQRNLFDLRDQRNFGISRSTEFLYSRSTEFLMLAIDGIFNVRDRRNFNFRDRQIKRLNQAIESSDRIKRSSQANQAIDNPENS